MDYGSCKKINQKITLLAWSRAVELTR